MNYLTHEEVQQELLKLLCIWDKFAKANKLRYTLYTGTLLGAVRHAGFIPWDDDVDVGMPRPDYDRLLKLKKKFIGSYRLLGPLDSELPYPFAKFCNMNVCCQERGIAQDIKGFLWIDIFPLDGMPISATEAKKQFAAAQSLKKRAGRKIMPASTKAISLIKRPYQRLSSLCAPASKDYAALDKLSRRTPYGTTGYCRGVSWALYQNERFYESDFEKLIELPFCNACFPAVKHWDEALRSMYGDYMQLPSEDKRHTHDALAWRI